MDKIKEDLQLIKEGAGMHGMEWFYDNGLGGRKERFEKKANVFNIFLQSVISSPIESTVGISQQFGNVSAICVLPQYDHPNLCNIENMLLVYGYYSSFTTSSSKILRPRESSTINCSFGNRRSQQVTCNSYGAIFPHPTNIDCGEDGIEGRALVDTTNQLVSNCRACFARGTERCEEVRKENGQVEGYRCVCRSPFYMQRCWRTRNACTPNVCGPKGKCKSIVGEISCSCDFGYAGERCERNLREQFLGDFGYSSASGATITLGQGLLKIAKIAVLGYSMANGQGDDPQDTHQRLRLFCTVGAGFISTMWSNPTVFGIPKIACRFYFILLHYFYLYGMLQWLFEAWNVNQVLRAVHLNEWEVDARGRRTWGVRIAARLAGSAVGLAVFLLLAVQNGWDRLAAPWTCVGVICDANLSVWFPLVALVIGMILFSAAILESSTLILMHRPMLAYQIDMRIERQLGFEEGLRVNKCRNNALLSFIGLILLASQWMMVIISSDYRDEFYVGIATVLMSGVYSGFCSFQEMMTDPEERGKFVELLQRYLPRFAPVYNPMTLWNIDEVREHFSLPKAQREEIYESFISRNKELMMHHRWDIRLNEILEDTSLTVNDALVKVFCEEMNLLKARRGTKKQKEQIENTYRMYMDSIPHNNPVEAGRLKGRLELVTLATEDARYVGGVRIARFFIVPKFHTFEPEIPEQGKSKSDVRKRTQTRKLLEDLEANIYEMTRENAQAQARFMNSAIHFISYGQNVVR